MLIRKPRTVKVAVTPIFCDKGFAQIFGSSADCFEFSAEVWERICSTPDASPSQEIMCSLRELKTGIQRLIGEEDVKVFFPQYIRENQKRILERELGATRVDSLTPDRWPTEVYSSLGEAPQRAALRESFRARRCIGATIRQEMILSGMITLDEESPFIAELMDFIDYRRPSNVSFPVSVELQFEGEESFCVDVDYSDFERQKPHLLTRIIAF